MKICILNDTHCGIKNGNRQFIKYQERFYNEVFWPYMLKNNIKRVLHLGDYFDSRINIDIAALASNRKVFLDKLVEHDVIMDIITGNHDIRMKNTRQLSSVFEVLHHYSNINIIEEPRIVDYDGIEFALIPWITPESYQSDLEFMKNTSANYMAGHFELSDFYVMSGVKANHGMKFDKEILDKFKKIYSGHYHTKSQKNNVIYLGAQMEFTWADANDPKYFHVFDTETEKLVAIRNPITMYEYIIYDDKEHDYTKTFDFEKYNDKYVRLLVQNRNDMFIFDTFLTELNKHVYDLKITENFDVLKADNITSKDFKKIKNTKELIDDYIDSMSKVPNKHIVKSLMQQLYVKAQMVD